MEAPIVAATPPSPWVALVRALPEMAEMAFAEKFDKAITVDMKIARDIEGRPTPTFSFTLAKPGLLPTAIERAWFDGYVSGYRKSCNMVLDMFDAASNAQVPS